MGCQVDPTHNTSTDSSVMLALTGLSVAAGFDAKRGAVTFEHKWSFLPEFLIEVKQKCTDCCHLAGKGHHILRFT